MIKIIVTGAKGRMGGLIAKRIEESNDLSLAAAIDMEGSIESVIREADVIVDFTVPAASANHARIAAEHAKPIIIGTTGLSAEQESVVQNAAKRTPIVHSPNMSVGINVMWKAIEIAARALGRQYKVDIVETHHIHKLDKPSGTARRILDIVLKESGRRLERDVFFHEEGTPPHASEDLEVSVRSIRRGEVIGDHAVHFTNPGETLSINHNAANRGIFADGALVAARWIVGKPAGLYGMDDVLNLNGKM